MSLKFGYWAPIFNGGYVLSSVPQRTEWSIDANIRLAQTAENVGFDYTLLPARFTTLECGDGQNDALATSVYLAAATQRLKIIGAFHTAYWHPAVIAKAAATIDVASGGRYALNILSGWLKAEFDQLGVKFLEHDERYRQSEEFIEVLKGLWTSREPFTYNGEYFKIKAALFGPRPPSEPYPELFQGGNSKAARRMAARYSDWYFLNGNSYEGAKEQIDEIKSLAARYGREVKFGLNGFVILRDTLEEGLAQKQAIIDGADPEIVNAFAGQAAHAGQSTKENVGMWSQSKFEDLVQPNDGFKTQLIGPAELIVERLRKYNELGVNLILTAYLHFNDELEEFGRKVISQFKKEEELVRVQHPGLPFVTSSAEPALTGHATTNESRRAQEAAFAR